MIDWATLILTEGEEDRARPRRIRTAEPEAPGVGLEADRASSADIGSGSSSAELCGAAAALAGNDGTDTAARVGAPVSPVALDADGLPCAPCPACDALSFWRISPGVHEGADPRDWRCRACEPPSHARWRDACCLPPLEARAP